MNNRLIAVCQSLSKPGNAGLLYLSAIAHKVFILIGKSWKKASVLCNILGSAKTVNNKADEECVGFIALDMVE